MVVPWQGAQIVIFHGVELAVASAEGKTGKEKGPLGREVAFRPRGLF